MNIDYIKDLLKCFPGSFINSNFEFIADKKSNTYFSIDNCSEFEIKCKLIEYVSRSCYKTEPYRSKIYNDKFHIKMLNGFNDYLGTNFDSNDMIKIYTYLGNGVNHKKTMEFVIANFDMTLLGKDD